MASPISVRELRYLASTTRSTAYVAADAAGWAADTASKIRATAYDASGLIVTSVPDPSLVQRVYTRNAPIATLRKGDFSMSTFMPCSPATTAADAAATLLGHVMGGIASPTARAYAVAASGVGTTTALKIYATGIEAEAVGTAVLIDGEVRSIIATGTNYIDLSMALAGVPDEGAVITMSTTVYPDYDADQVYVDWLAIGHDAADQRQMLACQAKACALQGAAPGELPQLAYTWTAADWQRVASGDLDQLEPTQASLGARPPAGYGIGGIWLQDAGTTTRTAFKGAELSVPNLAPNVEYTQFGVLGGVDYARVAPDGFKASLKVLKSQDTGLQADFLAGTAKQIIMQWGNLPTLCAAVELPYCYANSDPKDADISGMAAEELELIASTHATITTNDLTTAPIRVHCF